MCSFSHELVFALFSVEAKKTNGICEPEVFIFNGIFRESVMFISFCFKQLFGV